MGTYTEALRINAKLFGLFLHHKFITRYYRMLPCEKFINLIRYKTLKALKVTLDKGFTKSEALKNEICTSG